jgi:hypothetical protein
MHSLDILTRIPCDSLRLRVSAFALMSCLVRINAPTEVYEIVISFQDNNPDRLGVCIISKGEEGVARDPLQRCAKQHFYDVCNGKAL